MLGWSDMWLGEMICGWVGWYVVGWGSVWLGGVICGWVGWCVAGWGDMWLCVGWGDRVLISSVVNVNF